ncbi:MAG: hypothetical protein KKE02_05725 [Alphaproteobacteria bacterium]|nr:hypothetical protein [Alphaproteobacteria bacterium]MBU1516444.1 hypothetical protein [Alphaproteobacteria bacterium]MBU2094201.1 hypothetical protein [Alphaproteobacteria bacterium]MBU2150499.1 hypothetical protein [Alphaproteobacteria bacterium]MBU2307371.1 hypothetical protein [Alphaproteobacteria bacterium]
MAARLKVFLTSDGLTDYIVAATSKPKALEAWGSHQDLFKTGLAHETDDEALLKAAGAQPGQVLKRPAGSRATLEKLKPARADKPKPAGPSKAALKKVSDAEVRLATADAAHARELADLDTRRAALETKHAKAREKLQAALAAAREALD